MKKVIKTVELDKEKVTQLKAASDELKKSQRRISELALSMMEALNRREDVFWDEIAKLAGYENAEAAEEQRVILKFAANRSAIDVEQDD